MARKGGYVKPRSEMTEAERLEARRRAKQVACQRALGRPVMCTPEELARARVKARAMAHKHGMSTAQIAAASGVSNSTIKDLMTGRRVPGKPLTTIMRPVYDGVMAAEIQPPDGRARVPIEGARRRLQALTRQGFHLQLLSEFLGIPNYQRVWQHMHTRTFIYWDSYRAIVEMYDKHRDEDPADYCGNPVVIKRTIATARKKGWAPSWAWDEDTIDEPEAHPEWTGACGTEEGYRIHIRETLAGNYMPPCGPCKAATEVTPAGGRGAKGADIPFEFQAERFREALKERDLNPRRLAARMELPGKASDRFYRWLAGDRQPKNRTEVYALAEALDVPPGELMRDLRPGEGGKRFIGQPGGFNPFVFRAVVEASGMSFVEVSRMCGVTDMTIGKWVRGSFQPRDKEILKPFAEALGIDVEVFYQ